MKEEKKKPYNILKDYRPSGNNSIDAVASCIMWHRQRKIALKAIHLKPYWFELFKKGTEQMLGRPLEDGEGMKMDGVNIELGSLFQVKPFLPETHNDFNHNLGL